MKRALVWMTLLSLMLVACGEGSNLFLKTSKTIYDIDAAGGDIEILVETNATDWSVTISEDWANSVSENKVIVTVPKNTAYKDRTAVVTFSAEGMDDVAIGITQKARLVSNVQKDLTLSTSNLNGDRGKYSIYLPADYQKALETGKKYPVLYLLHGMWSHNNEWLDNGKVKQTTDAAVKGGKLAEMIVVMPNAYDSFYVDGYMKGINYESFFWNDLKPYIESNYPVSTERSQTAIAGLSMGGFGCTYYAFTHPEEFFLCYEMSGAVEGMGTQLVPSLKQIFEREGYSADNFGSLPTYIMDCGTEDSMCLYANINTHNYLASVGFPHEYILRSGAHDWVFWEASYVTLVNRLGQYWKPATEKQE